MPSYADVFVSKELLEKLKREQDAAPKNQRYGRFKAWLHYANLKSWQGQGWHFNYLNYMGTEHHCTCGLIVPVDAKPEFTELSALDLDSVQRARGHRRLPQLAGESVAFIYDYKWMEEKGVYYYKALCQICAAHTGLLPGDDADDFVDGHNRNCVSDGVAKVKE
jgi:hypothetical protein